MLPGWMLCASCGAKLGGDTQSTWAVRLATVVMDGHNVCRPCAALPDGVRNAKILARRIRGRVWLCGACRYVGDTGPSHTGPNRCAHLAEEMSWEELRRRLAQGAPGQAVRGEDEAMSPRRTSP